MISLLGGERSQRPPAVRTAGNKRAIKAYGLAVLVVVASASVGGVAFGRKSLADVIMIYMLGIVVVALRLGRGPSLLAAALSVLSFDFFFVPPFYSLAVSDL